MRTLTLLAAVVASTTATRSRAATDDHWTNSAGGTWDVAGNWDLGIAPTNFNFDAIIDLQTASPYEIDIVNGFSNAGITLNSSNATIVQGQNTVSTPFLNIDAGTYTLNGGTLSGTTISASGGTFSVGQSNGTFDGVTVGSNLSFATNQITVLDGLTLANSTLSLLDTAGLYFGNQSQNIGGSGTIELAGNGSSLAVYAGTITIGSGISVVADTPNSSELGVYTNGTVINNGFVSATNGAMLAINPGTLTNAGVLSATGSSTLNIGSGGTFTNSGTISAASGSTVSIGDYVAATSLGYFTTNNGAGTVQIGSGGDLYIAQPAINTGTVFTLTDVLTLNGGTISGGVIETSGAGSLAVGPNGGTLDGVTLTVPLSVPTGQVSIDDGLTLSNTTITLNNSSSLYAASTTQTIGGTGTIDLNGNGASFALYGGTLTLGANLNVVNTGATTGSLGVYGFGDLINDGSISAVSNSHLTVSVGMLVNNGMIQAAPGSSVTINGGTLTNNGLLDALPGGTISIGASLSATDLGSFSTSGGSGTVELSNGGMLYLNGGTLTLPDTLTLNGGLILFGTISTTGNGSFIVGSSGGTLDGITLAQGLDFDSAQVHVLDGITLNSITINELSSADLYFGNQDQTIQGNGTINLAGSGDSLSIYGCTVTIAPTITINGTSSNISTIGTYGFGTLINNGNIAATASGSQIIINPGTFINNGTVSAASGSAVQISGGTLTNSGTLSAQPGGTISIGATILPGGLGFFSTSGGAGTIELINGGVLENANTNTTITDILTLNGGEIDGGTLTATAAGSLQFGANGGTLDGVTLVNIPLPAGATVTGGLTVDNGSVNLSGSGSVTFDNTGSFALSGNAVFNQSDSSMATFGGPLVIAPASGDMANYNLSGGTLISQESVLVGPSGNGTFSQTGGVTTITGVLSAGNDGTLGSGTGHGVINISAGTLTADTILLGSTAGGSGDMTVSGTANVTVGGGAHLNDLNVNGGTFTVLNQAPPTGEDPELNRAIVGGYLTNGALNVGGGTVVSPLLKLGITSGKTGTFTESSGTVTLNMLSAGNDGTLTSGSGSGIVNISGGSLYADTVLLGSTAGGSGDMTVSGSASVTIGGGAHLNDLNVNGGTVTVLDQTPPAGEDPELNRALVGGYLSNGALIVNGGVVTSPDIKLGITSGMTGTFNLSGGTVNVGTLGVGNDASLTSGAGIGTATVSGGALVVNTLLLGSTVGGSGDMTVNGTASVTIGGGAHLNDLNVNGGTVTVLDQTPPSGEDPELNRALVGGYLTNGALNVGGGIVTTPNIKLGITANKIGTFNLTAGTVNVGTLAIGNDASLSTGAGTGIANLSGGSLSVGSILVGSSAGGVGSLNISAAANIEVTHAITISSGSHFSMTGGTLTLNGAIFSYPGDPCIIGDGTHVAELNVHNSTVALAGATVMIAAHATLDGGGDATPQNVGIASFSNTSAAFSGSTSILHLTLGGDPTQPGTAGMSYDQIVEANGTFSTDAATLQLLPLSTIVYNKPYPIVVTGTGGALNYTQAFSSLTTDPSYAGGSASYSVSYSPTEIDVTFTSSSVPEPMSSAGVLLGLGSFLLRRKRREQPCV